MTKTALVILALTLAGCGFQPLLGRDTAGSAADDLASIRVLAIADRSGQLLRNKLADDLSPRGQAGSRYTLQVRLQEPRQEIAINRDESASRIAYTASANFVLRNAADGRALFSGSSSSSSTFEATNSEFASINAQIGARDRVIQQISADMRQQLAAYFGRARAGADTPLPPP